MQKREIEKNKGGAETKRERKEDRKREERKRD